MILSPDALGNIIAFIFLAAIAAAAYYLPDN